MLLKQTEMNKSCRIPKADMVEHKLPVINLSELFITRNIYKAASYQSPDTCCSGAKGMDGTVMLVGAMQRMNVLPILQYLSCISAKGYI